MHHIRSQGKERLIDLFTFQQTIEEIAAKTCELLTVCSKSKQINEIKYEFYDVGFKIEKLFSLRKIDTCTDESDYKTSTN